MRVTVSPAVNICSDHILGSALPPPRLDEWTDPVGGFRRFQTVSDGFRSKFSDRPTQQREGIDFGPTRPTDPLFGRSDTQITLSTSHRLTKPPLHPFYVYYEVSQSHLSFLLFRRDFATRSKTIPRVPQPGQALFWPQGATPSRDEGPKKSLVLRTI